MNCKFYFALVVVVVSLREISGHGYLYDPPNRASLWRYDWKQPANYEDNELFCGGVQVQYGQNGGLCGVCGDNYADPQPRSNENTGTFGNGLVLRTYESGGVVNTNVVLTANHMGTFTYSICKLDDVNAPEQEECFTNLKLVDGSRQYRVQSTDYYVNNAVQLPEGLTCARCVLRWHYTSGNSWGVCEDGTQKMGCGAQETFRSCADITIV